MTALYVRFRQLIHEFAKFGIIGVVGLIITNVGYAVMHSHGVGPVTSTTIATIIATIVAYIGNRYWSFKHRERTSVPREGLLFFVLNAHRPADPGRRGGLQLLRAAPGAPQAG